MNKNIGIVVGAIALVVIVGGVFASISDTDNAAMMEKQKMEQVAMEKEKMEKEAMLKEQMMKDEAMEKDALTKAEDSMMKEDDATMMEKDEGAMMDTSTDGTLMKDEQVMMKAGSYESYASTKVAMASVSHDVVLFFRASWCPTCRAVDADIKAHLKDIPGTLSILDVDYDNSTDLKKKYGVTYQHTFVQVDAQGNLIKKWSGSPTLSALVAEVK